MSLFQEQDGRYVYRRNSTVAVVMAVSAGLGVLTMSLVVYFLMSGRYSGHTVPGEAMELVVPVMGVAILVNILVGIFIFRRFRGMNSLEIDQMERTVTFFEQRTSPAGFPSGGKRTTLQLDTADGVTISEAAVSGPMMYGGQHWSLDLLVQGEKKPLFRVSKREEAEQIASEFSTLTGLTLR